MILDKDIKKYSPVREWINTAVDILPYGSLAKDAYINYKFTRYHNFLNRLKFQENSMDKEELKKLNQSMNSDEGKELLAEFIESAVLTNSEVAGIVFAILYSKYAIGSINVEQTRFICSALNGIDDFTISAFLALCDRPITHPENGGFSDAPYPVTILSKQDIDHSTKLRSILTDEEAISVINELIRRKIFLPDYTFDRATPGHWTSIYGLNSKAIILKELIIKAQELLKLSQDK